jgi:cytochrome c556
MRRWARVMAVGAGALLAAATQAARPEDGKAAFERREDTMKHMGRPFYLGIGRVVKGTTAYKGLSFLPAGGAPEQPAT